MKKIITSTFGLLSSACYLTRSHQPITENNNYDLASPKPCFKSRK
jgi:glycerol-3-phosphate dehydrogenase